MQPSNRTSFAAAAGPLLGALLLPAVALADDDFRATLRGFEEVPAVSTTGKGRFRAEVENGNTLEFVLTYEDLEGTPSAAHIHLGQRDVNGAIIVVLCGSSGAPDCPPSPGRIEGTVKGDDDWFIGSDEQGIAAGEFNEFLRALERGVTYVNVHSDKFPGGEIRGQIRED